VGSKNTKTDVFYSVRFTKVPTGLTNNNKPPVVILDSWGAQAKKTIEGPPTHMQTGMCYNLEMFLERFTCIVSLVEV